MASRRKKPQRQFQQLPGRRRSICWPDQPRPTVVVTPASLRSCTSSGRGRCRGVPYETTSDHPDSWQGR